jgi:hypothetical protein
MHLKSMGYERGEDLRINNIFVTTLHRLILAQNDAYLKTKTRFFFL